MLLILIRVLSKMKLKFKKIKLTYEKDSKSSKKLMIIQIK